MTFKRGIILALTVGLAACGGGDDSSATSFSATPPTASAPPATNSGSPPTGASAGTCSLRARQDWVLAQLQEFYLFPDLLAQNVNPNNFSTVQEYIDALVAPARAAGRDKFFTFITSIEEENAFFASGETAGFGFRLTLDSGSNRLFIIDSFEGAPALAAGIDRGTELLAIGTNSNNLRSISNILAAEGTAGLNAALGASTPGLSRVLQFRPAGGSVITTTVTKQNFDIPPISSRFGVRIFDDGGKRVGYINLRTFIGSADDALRDAFAQLRAQDVTEVILDLRYNGGGLVRVAETFGDLLGRNRFRSDVFSFTTFRASLSNNNDQRNFVPQPQSIAPTKIAVIGTSSTASASELVTNAFLPYLGADIGLIGSNTSGKPVGQIGVDRAECDDRLRIVAFATQNADREGEYFNGLAGVMDATCSAPDDILRPLGNMDEGSISQSLSFLRGESCTPIAGATLSGQSANGAQSAANISLSGRELLMPPVPSPAQREVPGTY